MANAPTTRPPNRRSERSAPPRGPRPVARKYDVDRTREHLKIAAEELQYSLPEVSETLLALREPFGNRMLVPDRETGRVPAGTTNVAILMPKHLRKAIQEAALGASESKDAKVQDLLGRALASGIRQVLDGQATPRDIPREPRGSGVEKVNLNVPVDSGVFAELREALPVLEERLGFKPSIAKIAFRLLLDEYGLEYKTAENAFAGTSLLQLHLPPRLADAIAGKLGEVGEEMHRLISEGYGKVLDGSWRPYEIPKAAKGSDYERTRWNTRANTVLLDKIRKKCPELKQQLGYPVTPQTIAIDYLVSELGLEDVADAEYGISR